MAPDYFVVNMLEIDLYRRLQDVVRLFILSWQLIHVSATFKGVNRIGYKYLVLLVCTPILTI
jgi:hypothetical protein